MRIGTYQLQQQSLSAMLDQQSRLAKTQQQVSTGQRLVTPSDDPAAASQALDLERMRETLKQYQKNADMARNRLSLEENALVSVEDAVLGLRELAIQGNSGTLTPTDRAQIASEARELLRQLVTLANTSDANGEFLFSGYNTATQPFTQSASGTVSYAGDAGSRSLQISGTRQVAAGDSGQDVFRAIRNGNGTFVVEADSGNTGTGVIDPGSVTDPSSWVADTYTLTFLTATTYEVRDSANNLETSGTYSSGGAISFNGIRVSVSGTPAANDSFTIEPSANQDLFTTALNLATALEGVTTTDVGTAEFQNNMNRFLSDIDQAQNHLLDFRARIGARLSAIDSQKDINDSTALTLDQSISQLKDLDYAEAISRLNLQLTGLEAAQLSFVRIQGLSLFNFLR